MNKKFNIDQINQAIAYARLISESNNNGIRVISWEEYRGECRISDIREIEVLNTRTIGFAFRNIKYMSYVKYITVELINRG